MCDTERNTARRGRSAVPSMRLRWRSRMRSRRSFLVRIFISPSLAGPHPRSPAQRRSFVAGFAVLLFLARGAPPRPEPVEGPRSPAQRRSFVAGFADLLRAGLPDLLLQHFAGVAYALLLVRVGLPQSTDVRGDLADELPVDPGD